MCHREWTQVKELHRWRYHNAIEHLVQGYLFLKMCSPVEGAVVVAFHRYFTEETSQLQTNASVIMDLNEGAFYIAKGASV